MWYEGKYGNGASTATFHAVSICISINTFTSVNALGLHNSAK